METTIREYESIDNNDCIEAFESNVPHFFTKEEIQDFKDFLVRIETGNDTARFFVVIFGQKVIGCGGYGDKEKNGVFSLAWGFIHRDFHKKGFGKKLLLYRIGQIKKLNPESMLILDTTQYSFGFFEKYGFQTTKVSNDYYAIGMHRYDMVLKT
jgi:ribosomal protein S18 acetylase RimI-like enzyme